MNMDPLDILKFSKFAAPYVQAGFNYLTSRKNGGKKGRVRRPYRGRGTSMRAMMATRSLMQPEIHYLDTSYAATTPPVGGSVTPVNLVANGSDYNQRDGRCIVSYFLQYDIVIAPPTAVGISDSYQVAIFHDINPSTASTVYSGVYDVAVNPLGLAFRNIARNGDRFTLLREFRGFVINGSPLVMRRFRGVLRIPTNLCRSVYSSAAAAIPESGGLFFLTASVANTGLAASACTVTASFRLAFHDI